MNDTFEVVKGDQLRHFRIGFDHYGTFDVLALGVEVEAVEWEERRLGQCSGMTPDRATLDEFRWRER